MNKNTEKSVVIVDDSAHIREKVGELIASIDTCHVSGTADNGKAALELIDAVKPDIVILDIRMPEMSGLDVLEQLQNLLTDICFIVFSNHNESAYASRCEQLGADYCLDKNKDFDSLRQILEAPLPE